MYDKCLMTKVWGMSSCLKYDDVHFFRFSLAQKALDKNCRKHYRPCIGDMTCGSDFIIKINGLHWTLKSSPFWNVHINAVSITPDNKRYFAFLVSFSKHFTKNLNKILIFVFKKDNMIDEVIFIIDSSKSV